MAAARLGLRCHIFAPEPGSPASQVAAAATVADYDDHAALRSFAEQVDVVTFEFENVSVAGLDLLASLRPVRPSASVLRISQDRALEKDFLNASGASTAQWRRVDSRPALHAAATAIGLPAVLKTTRLGYDGRGQRLVRDPADLDAAWEALAPKPLILEAFVDFACELSVIAVRGSDGSVSVFDPVENRHRDHILDLTLAPARIDRELSISAQSLVRRLAEGLDLVGLLTLELFLGRDGTLLANEIAPRPHNSGHWTIDACPASQFELFVRAVVGLPLPQAVRHSDAVMKNLVGPAEMDLWPAILAAAGVIPHCYGKAEARPGRKLGHVTRLFPRGGLPGDFGIAAALGPLGQSMLDRSGDPLATGDAP